MIAHNPFADVRSAVTLSQYVEATYGSNLRSRGQGKYSTSCPVHGGDNPNAFHIDDDKGLWKCFTQCGRGGDVFTLYEMSNPASSKRDALVAVAEYAGVTLPEKEQAIDKRTLYRTMNRAAGLFANALTSTRPKIGDDTGALEAYEWITDERGVSDDVLDLAQIGFVPDFPGLRSALEDLLGSRRILLECGILAESAAGNIYCPFAGRVVFPIRNENGRVVGFGGRVVPDVTHHQSPKFVNTRQTEIYDKSSVLYGAEFVSDDTEEIIVCEGYMDAIAVNALDNPAIVGVAACGVAVTRSHVDLIDDIAPRDTRIVFAMDGDEAGKKSVARLAGVAELLRDDGFGILLDSDSGKDPWERYLSGTLEDDISPGQQQPLIDVVLGALRDTSDDFDEAVESLLTDAGSADFADIILRAAASLQGERVAEYGERVRRKALGAHSRRSANRGKDSARLSESVRHLVARLLQIPHAELQAVASAVGGWDTRGQGLIERWMPVEDRADVDALGYVLFPHADQFEPEIVQAVSACLSSEDEPESISPVLKGIERTVLASGARVARDASSTTLDRVKAVRSIAASEISVSDEVASLVLLIDVAKELEAAEG